MERFRPFEQRVENQLRFQARQKAQQFCALYATVHERISTRPQNQREAALQDLKQRGQQLFQQIKKIPSFYQKTFDAIILKPGLLLAEDGEVYDQRTLVVQDNIQLTERLAGMTLLPLNEI